ncbi:MAG TPA: MFS transporter [Xanthobacteraceae bacterium]|nr:MFS transporter [Xanthobacteraceae bacterium]
MAERSTTINVTELIDLRPITELQIRVTILCALMIFLDGVDLIMIGLTAPSIAAAIGVKVTSFGPVFGIGQVGLVIGVLVCGPLGDRFGRKRLIIGSVLLFAIFTLAIVWTTTFDQLLVYRFLAGIGLGGLGPNAVALTSEYAPKRLRAAFVAVQWSALPLGGVAVGLLSSFMLPLWGWQSLFYLGAIVPLILVVVLLFALPESVSFLLTRGLRSETVRQIVHKIAPDVPATADTSYVANEEKLPGAPMKHLFTERRAAMTLLLWVPFFTSFMILIFTTSWIPTLLRAGGLSVAQAGFAIALNSLGSFAGSASVGRVMDWLGRYQVLIPAFILAALATGVLGFSTTTFATAAVAITLSGFFAGASQTGVIALAAVVYPVAIRSTGVGWAMAIGRIGAAVGPILGGILLSWQWPVDRIILCIAAPALLGALCVALIRQQAAHAATAG